MFIQAFSHIYQLGSILYGQISWFGNIYCNLHCIWKVNPERTPHPPLQPTNMWYLITLVYKIPLWKEDWAKLPKKCPLLHTGPLADLKKFWAPQFFLANSVNCYQGRLKIMKIKIPTRTLSETIKEKLLIKDNEILDFSKFSYFHFRLTLFLWEWSIVITLEK